MDFEKSEKYIAAHREETIEHLGRFLLADTLLFWSDKAGLNAYQKKHWRPILNDLNTVFKLDFKETISLIPAKNTNSEKKFVQLLNTLSDKELTACFFAASEMKSVLLGFLFAKHKIAEKDALEAAYLEELYQNRFWGEDIAAVNARKQSKQMLDKIAEYLA
ncbi:MAG: hypothetical protein IJ770_04615 [Alphaproteobacteria bacterium]|nr:hypothetical protein [Alphaproteobacteria bacterium]